MGNLSEQSQTLVKCFKFWCKFTTKIISHSGDMSRIDLVSKNLLA